MTSVFPGFSLELRKYGLGALEFPLEFVFACVDCVLCEFEGTSVSVDAIEGPQSLKKKLKKKEDSRENICALIPCKKDSL